MMALIYDLRRCERCTQREESPTSRMVWATSECRVSGVTVGGGRLNAVAAAATAFKAKFKVI